MAAAGPLVHTNHGQEWSRENNGVMCASAGLWAFWHTFFNHAHWLFSKASCQAQWSDHRHTLWCPRRVHAIYKPCWDPLWLAWRQRLKKRMFRIGRRVQTYIWCREVRAALPSTTLVGCEEMLAMGAGLWSWLYCFFRTSDPFIFKSFVLRIVKMSTVR